MRNTKLLVWLYLGVIVIIFSAQSYLIYFNFMPATLAPFKDFPVMEKHVQYALNKMMDWMTFWFLLGIGHILGYLIVSRKKSSK